MLCLDRLSQGKKSTINYEKVNNVKDAEEENDSGKSETSDEDVIMDNKPYLVKKTDKFHCSECTKNMVSPNTEDRFNDPH